jgi:4-amino-4-deoxy-L-arabinose transferase-like glycosyltransferase
MTPLYWLTKFLSPEGQLIWFRLAAIPLGMLTVLFAYLTTRTLFPRDRFLAMVVPAIVAFEPQVSYEAAMLNNDILAICLTGAIVWMTAVGLRRRFPLWNCLTIGSLFGLALLAKTTSVTVAALIAVGMVLGLGWRQWRSWLFRGAITGITTALIVWPWYVYMYRTYGDFNALSRIRALQWWNYPNGTPPTILSQLTDPNFFWAIWGGLWGGFGWFLIPLSDKLLGRLLLVMLFAMVGLAILAVRGGMSQSPRMRCLMPSLATSLRVDRVQFAGLMMLGAMAAVSYLALLQFGTEFQGTQARYAFPAVTSVAILVACGFRAWFPQRWLPGVAASIIFGLVVLNVAIYTNYVIPWVIDHPGT